MHPADVVFSNLRVAPVQVTSYGHSSSTHGSKIDYFIGGADVEQWEAPHALEVGATSALPHTLSRLRGPPAVAVSNSFLHALI